MNISIITCTYNPDERILSKVLEAVAKLIIPEECGVEYIIIDNNSNPPLVEAGYVSDFLKNITWSKVIVEQNQGLSHSRLRGFNESNGDIIVFYDDDNVADTNYLVELEHLFENNVQVGIWGPGNIDVIFMDPVPAWIEQTKRGIFQERKNKTIEFGYSLKGASFHPFGTGMSLRRDVMDYYYTQFLSKGFVTSDRKGDSLSSSGDIQLIYTAFIMGLATGVSPGLKMKHLIPGKRATLKYLCRLHYGIDISADTAFLESFPEYKDQVAKPSTKSVIKELSKRILSFNAIFNRNEYMIELSIYMGKIIGRYRALKIQEPIFLSKLVKLLKIES